MIQAFGKSIDLKINVVTDEIVLYGLAENAPAKVLRGSLVVTLSEPIKVKSVVLSFIGKMTVAWSEALGVGHHQQIHKQERNIITHFWDFVKNKKKSLVVLEAGQHKWSFELPLPGNLPQSLESDAGSVSYRLKATIERPAFIQNIIKKKVIRIQRCVIPSQFELVQSLEIRSTLADKIVYDISAPSKIYAFGDKIPVTFKIEPLASTLKVHAIRASLKEYCSYRANDRSKTDTRTICRVSLDNPFAPSSSAVVEKAGHTWKRVIELPVPPQSPMVFADTESDLIRIRHRLKFIISLVNAAGQVSELRSAVQVTMLESFAVTEELTCLPAYDEMWRSIPYSHDVLEQLRTQPSQAEAEPTLSDLTASRQPLTVSGWSRLLSLSSKTVPLSDSLSDRTSNQEASSSNASTAVNSSANSIQDEDIERQQTLSDSQPWWDGVDLAKVPSYRTISSIDSTIISNSLAPAYDSVLPRHATRS
ncbi:hypothetical protein EDC96DRAFT_512810 [Choanephora cucurbitarum]|nr:hypothetical protein EDC96DRAFT_512810 [Choanephora cucurbitarum]